MTPSFFKQSPILPTPPFLREKSEISHHPLPSPFSGKFQKLKPTLYKEWSGCAFHFVEIEFTYCLYLQKSLEFFN